MYYFRNILVQYLWCFVPARNDRYAATEFRAGCDAAVVRSMERLTRPFMYNMDTIYVLNKPVKGLWCHPIVNR